MIGPDRAAEHLHHQSRQSPANPALAANRRLRAAHWDKPYPNEGGLMSYGSDFAALHRRAAAYVDRILHGTKVNELAGAVPGQVRAGDQPQG